jgi:hypothetical protein
VDSSFVLNMVMTVQWSPVQSKFVLRMADRDEESSDEESSNEESSHEESNQERSIQTVEAVQVNDDDDDEESNSTSSSDHDMHISD